MASPHCRSSYVINHLDHYFILHSVPVALFLLTYVQSIDLFNAINGQLLIYGVLAKLTIFFTSKQSKYPKCFV